MSPPLHEMVTSCRQSFTGGDGLERARDVRVELANGRNRHSQHEVATPIALRAAPGLSTSTPDVRQRRAARARATLGPDSDRRGSSTEQPLRGRTPRAKPRTAMEAE